MIGVYGRYDEKRAERVIRFFGGLKHTNGAFHGVPFRLFDWQAGHLRNFYGHLREDGGRAFKYFYLEVPKKNGKSELAAGLALYHLFADGEKRGEIYSVASDKDQASIVFNAAVEMLKLCPALLKRARIVESKKMIKDLVSGSVYQVVSSVKHTKHGLNVSCVIFDELHTQPGRDLWDVMTFGAGDARRQPVWIVLTTAGDDPDRVSIGWDVHERARRILRFRRLAGLVEPGPGAGYDDPEDGDDPGVDDPAWYPVIYGYAGENIYSEEAWEMANPSLDLTIKRETVRDAARVAMESPANRKLFEWLRLNRWLTVKLTAWLPLELFDACAGDWKRGELLGLDCFIGLDLSSTTDLTGIAVVFPPQGKLTEWRVFWNAFLPREGIEAREAADRVPFTRWASDGFLTLTEGDVIDYEVIEAVIGELGRFYNVREVCADRAMGAMLLQRLEKQGFVIVDIPQTYQALTDPMNLIDSMMKRRAGWGGTGDGGRETEEDGGRETGDGEGWERDREVEYMGPGIKELNARISVERNPVARWCFGNTSIAKNGQGYIKFVKQTKGKGVERTRRIDLLAAWVDAMARARFYSGPVDISEEILRDDWGF